MPNPPRLAMRSAFSCYRFGESLLQYRQLGIADPGHQRTEDRGQRTEDGKSGSPVFCSLSSVLCPLFRRSLSSSVLCPLSSVLCLLSFVLCPLDEALWTKPSAL